MGTGPSKLVESATPEQKSQIGVFLLGRKEKYAVEALSTILTKMLEANRLFDINRLLMTKAEPDDKNPFGCSSLFMVIQSAIESEFLRLKFQEPKVGTTVTSITTVPKDYYDKHLSERSGRTKLCRDLTHFLVRLITLVGALAASIKSNSNLLDLMNPPTIEIKKDSIKRLEITDALKRRFGIVTKQIPNIFLENDFSILIEKKDVFVFRGNSSYVIDKERMLLYNTSDKTPVFQIMFEDKEEVNLLSIGGATKPQLSSPSTSAATTFLPASQQLPPQQFPPQQLPPQQLLKRPNNASTVYTNASAPRGGPLSSVGSSTRRQRRARRRTTLRRRRQFGGGFDEKNSLFRVTLTNWGTDRTYIFYTNLRGDTYDSSITSFIPGGGQGRQIPPSEPIGNRLGTLFAGVSATETTFFETDEKSTDAKKEIFAGLQSYDKDAASSAITKLKKSFTEINDGRGEGTAPAPYRAFLLASRSEGGPITHMLCSDAWRGQWATSVMTYSLFQTLYNTTEDGQMSPDTAVECEKMAKAFVDSGAMISRPEPGKEAKGFHNLRFTPLPEVLTATICAQTKSINPTSLERTPGDIAILRKAHNDIRLAYEAYIDKLIPFTMSIVKVVRAIKEGVQQEVTFRLDPAFFTTEGTSLDFLERKITEARLLIGAHLLQVEKIYADAVRSLELSKKGVRAAVPLESQ